MGYPSGIKGYLILNLKDKKFYITRDMTFREKIFPLKKDNSIEIDKNKDICIPKISIYDSILFSHDNSNKKTHKIYRPSICKNR